MWVLWAFSSALCAGLSSVLAKCGVKHTDSTLATALRTVVVLVMAWAVHLGGYCPGCGGGEGNQSCAIARCSLEHGGPEFCWDCPEYPCARYEGFDECDSFVPHSARARDAAEARSLGIEAYMARMRESAALLAARLLTEAAQARGLSLKLVKKP